MGLCGSVASGRLQLQALQQRLHPVQSSPLVSGTTQQVRFPAVTQCEATQANFAARWKLASGSNDDGVAPGVDDRSSLLRMMPSPQSLHIQSIIVPLQQAASALRSIKSIWAPVNCAVQICWFKALSMRSLQGVDEPLMVIAARVYPAAFNSCVLTCQ